MSDFIPGTQQESVESAPGATDEQAGGLHESWTKALDEAGLPDLFRGENSPLMAQIRRSEAESNRKIEELSAQRAPEPWQQLITQAGDEVTPQELVDAYNAAQQIRQDPFGFIDGYVRQVNGLVESGEMTAPEGWAARYRTALGQGASQQQAADFADESDPFNVGQPQEDPRIAELEQWKRQQEAREQQQQEEFEAQQQEQAEEEWADRFFDALDTSLVQAGFAADVAGIDDMTRKMVGTIATNIIDASEDGSIDYDKAIPMAIQQVAGAITARGGHVGSQAPARPQIPVGGGSNAMPAVPGGFASKEERNAAMLAAVQGLG